LARRPVRRWTRVAGTATTPSKRCRFDDDAVFQFSFEPQHVSMLDDFHPSLIGQAELAEITWLRSWWS
jgi:hypothetical protein